MKTERVKRTVFALMLACALSAFFMSGGKSAEAEDGLTGTGRADPEVLRESYKLWEAQYLKNGGGSNLILALHWSKGLPDEKTKGSGHVKIDMNGGRVAAAVSGLSASEGWDLWLVQNLPDSSILPEQEDTLVKLD